MFFALVARSSGKSRWTWIVLCFVLFATGGETKAKTSDSSIDAMAEDFFEAAKKRRELPDVSEKGLNAWVSYCVNMRTRLLAVKYKGLKDQSQITRRMLLDTLDSDVEYIKGEWVYTDVASAESMAQTLMDEVGFAFENRSATTWNKTIELFSKSNEWIDGYISLLKRGQKKGKVQYLGSVKRTIGSLEEFVQNKSDGLIAELPNVLKEALPKSSQRTRLLEKLDNSIQEGLLPAHKRLLGFLKNEYVKDAKPFKVDLKKYRRDMNIHLGDAYADPQVLHQQGKDKVEEARIALERLVKQIDPKAKSVGEFFRAFNSDSSNQYPSYEILKKEAQKHIDRALRFARGHTPLPRFDLQIEPIAKVYENIATAWYFAVSVDRANEWEKGRMELNAGPLLSQIRPSDIATLMTHEIAGHHVAMGYIAKNTDSLPMFRNTQGSTVADEGIATYTEYLRHQGGDLSSREQIGYWVYRLYLAGRLVVDTGLHTGVLTREEAIGYLMDVTYESRSAAESEIDRYLEWPAQALAYQVGLDKVIALRNQIEQKLGKDHFDERWFHKNLLSLGSIPLGLMKDVMNKRATRRLAQRKSAKNMKRWGRSKAMASSKEKSSSHLKRSNRAPRR